MAEFSFTLRRELLFLFAALCAMVVLTSSAERGKQATLCTSNRCQLPDCFCAGARVPKGLKADSIPQFVMISFDGSVRQLNFKRVQKIFANRVNPNGCPIRGTFFVNHEWTDYDLTNKLYVQGHEIATHAVTMGSMEVFRKAEIDRWIKEIGGMKKILEIFAGIPSKDLKGFRAPYLAPGGDVMYDAIHQSGLSYDSTLVAGENNPPLWPYTLNYKSSQDCKVKTCPVNSHPGMWEIPLVQHIGGTKLGSACSMIDSCNDRGTRDSARDMILDNFMRHYTSNRAPFPLFMHAWFDKGAYRFEAFMEFLETIQILPDVYIVTISDVIEWIKNPVPCETPASVNMTHPACTLKAMKSWSCKNPEVQARRPPCDADEVRHCVVKKMVGGKAQDRSLKTCKSCPDVYPWIGNPDGNWLEMEGIDIKESEKAFWYAPRGVNLTKHVEEKKVDPFANFKKMDPKERFRMYLRRKMNNVNDNVLARVFGNF